MKALLLVLAALAPPVSLASVEVVLPDDRAEFTGADADLLNANCGACHSPSMVLLQPRMDAKGWAQSVTKMRQVYKAPIEEADVPKLAEALARATAR